MDPISTWVVTSVWKATVWTLKDTQKWMLNYFLVIFFWKKYKNYLKQNILIHKEATLEAENEFNNNIDNIKDNPNPILLAVQNESEVEYKNMFWILEKASLKIEDNADWNIDEDKIKRLKDLSKEFGSDELQDLVSSILAWEYNKSWSYSLQTMAIVKNLSKEDLLLFRRFAWLVIDWEFIFWSFYGLAHKNLNMLYSKWIWHDQYSYLQELGLVMWSMVGTKLWNNTWKLYVYDFKIANKKLSLYLKKEITLNDKVQLSKAWKELFKLIEPIFDQEIFEMNKEELIKQGFVNDIDSIK